MHDWQAITKEQPFTSDGTGSYPLSTLITDNDFRRTLTGTEWDRTNQNKIYIVSAAEWQTLKAQMLVAGPFRNGRVRGNNLLLYPDAVGDNLIFEYISKNYVIAADNSTKGSFTADDDTTAFDENLLELGLKYYLKSEFGLPAEEDADKYYDAAEDLASQEKPMPIIRARARYNGRPVANIPYSGAGL